MTARPSGGSRALPGVVVAALTACISGVSVFVNSEGVHAIAPPSVYTTAKNLVATLVLAAVVLAGARVRRDPLPSLARFVSAPEGRHRVGGNARRSGPWRWIALAYVGVVGGGVAFVLFFDGLAQTTATPAAFLHDGLVVWVALLAVPFLRERLTVWNVLAIVLLMVGQVAVLGGVGDLAVSRGQMLVLVATWLWAVEVVVSKWLLADIAPGSLALIRMGVGSVVLLVDLGLTGELGALVGLSSSQLGWALATGLLLAGYVGTWMTALARARAVDVTSVLVGSTVVTSLLGALAGTSPLGPADLGLLLIAAGAGLLIVIDVRRRVAS